MKHFYIVTTFLLSLLLSGIAVADKPAESVYLDGDNSKVGLILLHGKGKHPKWKVVNPVREAVNKQLGYHTLSLQMPNTKKLWKQYAADFPEAYHIIKDGIRFLQEKGVSKIFLMGHSMGSRMASGFVAMNNNQPVAGLIVAGCRNNGDRPLSCLDNLQNVKIPVLDIWGGKSDKDVDAASERQDLVSENYRQLEIAGTNHKFDSHNHELISAVVDWLKSQQ